MSARIRTAAGARVDIASLAAFRIIFGLVMFGGILRFLSTGWIESMYGEPIWFFTYPGFEWVRPWSMTGMYIHYGVLAALALAIALGAFHRIATVLFVIGFAYTQLIDVTNYLNHHYLVVLVGVLLACLPANAEWSIDAWRDPSLRRATVPAWYLWLLRFQIGLVYVFAGLAKAKVDWLGYGQPLNLWLAARTETPVIGRVFDEPVVALAMSWAGFLYDTTIVVWLSWRRTRIPAYLVLIVFHGLTGYLFNIGMFPLIMTTSALIFFSPSWPRRLLTRLGRARWAIPAPEPRPRALAGPLRRFTLAVIAVHVVVQLALPLRHLVYPGNVLWTEEGMRFAWHVMLREKHGKVMYVAAFVDGRRLEIPPRNYLTARQERELGGQPDLIIQLGRHVGADLEARGYERFVIHAITAVSLNGRAPVPMLDPSLELYRSRGAGPPARPAVAPFRPEPPGPPGLVLPLD